MPDEKQEKIDKLAAELLRHKALYYEGRPEISDYEYDKLEETLRALAPEHEVLQVVGAELTGDSSRPKQKHKIPMLSLAKTYELSELFSWQKNHELVVTPKIDGNSLSLIYRNGKLYLAKTRGNGIEGEDVTQKILWVEEIPKSLDPSALAELGPQEEIEIRGELYCGSSRFLELSEKMLSLGLPQATSTRNIVAGVLSRKQHIHLARYFNFFGFNALFEGDTETFKKETLKTKWLKKAGFTPAPVSLLKTEKETRAYLKDLKESMEDLDFPSDGAVFSFNDLALHSSLGETAHHPRYKMSFKWQGQTAVTTIKDINWSTSRFGTVTPVAHVEPVYLSEAKITNVTLHNLAHVKLFKLKAGDQIEIVRSGEVIPKFLQVTKQKPGEPLIPSECPSCDGLLREEDVRLICDNKSCGARLLHRIINWIRHSGIEDLSEKRLEPLLKSGKIKGITDLYRLTLEDFLELPFTKEKLATKLYTSLQSSKNLELLDFLCALGIEGSGKTTWRNLLAVFPSLEKILGATELEISEMDGFAEKTAEQIVRGLKENKSLIEDLQNLGLAIKEPKLPSGPLPLKGMSFVLTGSLSRPREEITSLLLSLGAKVSSSVTKKTYAVVSEDFSKKSSKTEKAKKLGILLWSEKDLMEFIESKKEQ